MKKRLDMLLVERDLAPSRTAAQALIMAGQVMVGENRADKSGQTFDESVEIRVKNAPRYVSRGGDKLASVMEQFSIDLKDKIVVDVGSSTGGFTDYCLQHGAAKVYCIDAGTNQLAYKLREDPRVVVMERTDIRGVETLPETPTIAVADLSFISLTKALTSIAHIISSDGVIIALMKPQFEAGKEIADEFKGIISDPKVRQILIDEFEATVAEDFEIIDAADSGVHGTQGNSERFYVLRIKT